jgi:hypothetical protein
MGKGGGWRGKIEGDGYIGREIKIDKKCGG